MIPTPYWSIYCTNAVLILYHASELNFTSKQINKTEKIKPSLAHTTTHFFASCPVYSPWRLSTSLSSFHLFGEAVAVGRTRPVKGFTFKCDRNSWWNQANTSCRPFELLEFSSIWTPPTTQLVPGCENKRSLNFPCFPRRRTTSHNRKRKTVSGTISYVCLLSWLRLPVPLAMDSYSHPWRISKTLVRLQRNLRWHNCPSGSHNRRPESTPSAQFRSRCLPSTLTKSPKKSH